MFDRLRRAAVPRRQGEALYESAVRQARQPIFYDRMGVPDTVDGRFEMIAMHVFLLLHRLRHGDETRETAQALFDAMFQDMDRSLRELGAGDLGVGRRVKAMAQAFYGRIAAYEQGLAEGGDSLTEAIRRNVFRSGDDAAPQAAQLADYLRVQASALDQQTVEALLLGKVTFSPSDETFSGSAAP